MQEECLEVINSKSSDDVLQELGYVIEVINSIANIENKNLNDIIEISKQKRLIRDGFSKKIYLEKTINKS